MSLHMRGSEQLRARLPQIARTALVAAALIPQNAAKILAPVKTGTLRRSIHIGGHNYGGVSSPIPDPVVTGDRVTVVVGTNLEYAPIVELGSANSKRKAKPYLRPALENNRTAIAQEFNDVARELIEKVG